MILLVSPPTSILDQFRAVEGAWLAAVLPYANTLFGLLATMELVWAGTILLLERADLGLWMGGMLRKVMWIGAFYTLLLFGPRWIPLIISSFGTLGSHAAGVPLSPSLVFQRGKDVAGTLFDAASSAGIFTHFGTALSLVFAAMAIFLSFVLITIQLVVTLVESYLAVAAGVIFLGFGGSRWTTPYVERYIALAVAIGVKLMCLYLLVSVCMSVSAGWAAVAAAIPSNPNPAMSSWEIAGAALIVMAICWAAPKFVSGVLSGAPALTGGDVVGMGLMVGSAGLLAAGGVAAGAASAAKAWGGGTSSRGTPVTEAASAHSSGDGGPHAGSIGESSPVSAGSSPGRDGGGTTAIPSFAGVDPLNVAASGTESPAAGGGVPAASSPVEARPTQVAPPGPPSRSYFMPAAGYTARALQRLGSGVYRAVQRLPPDGGGIGGGAAVNLSGGG